MPAYDPRVDAYIAKSAPFAQPILHHIRELVHQTCPDVTETLKWSMPFFTYNNGNLCHMAAFKQHCAFSFWLGALLSDPHGLITKGEDKTAMGHFGQIRTVADLPADKILMAYIREAMALIDQGAKQPKVKKAAPSPVPEMPPYFAAELQKNKQALTHFEAFSPSMKKEYLTWITEAKTEATRNKRMATALEWISEGKARHWKYEKC